MPNYTHAALNARSVERPHPNSGLNPRFADTITCRPAYGPGRFLPGIDGRSAWAKRVRFFIAQHLSDLGGLENCSEAEKSIIRRASVLSIEMERLERRFALVPLDQMVSINELDLYSRLANSLRRLLDVTGLERRSKDITPTIDQYVANHSNDPDNTDEAEDDIIDVIDPLAPPPSAYPTLTEARRSRREYLSGLKAERRAARAAKAAAKVTVSPRGETEGQGQEAAAQQPATEPAQ